MTEEELLNLAADILSADREELSPKDLEELEKIEEELRKKK